MRNINELMKQIIPLADYQHRNGFNNENIISSLSPNEKIEVEQSLIKMLENNNDDLIGETLTILKSKNSLQALRKRLELTKSPSSRIIWAGAINEINGSDEEMKNIALKEFENITEKYRLISTFHYLSRFQDSKINEMITTFINHNDYLIAYNARTSIGIETKEVIERERAKKRSNWWQL